MHIKVEHISKLFTDDTGRFPICSRSGNKYITMPYNCDSNAIIDNHFKSCSDKHRLLAYGAIMKCIKDRNILVYLQILDNEAITEYKRIIKAEWGVGYQLVTPHIHHRNAAERAIHTFKAHFLSILAGTVNTFPKNLWDLLITQTELTLNLLRQSTL